MYEESLLVENIKCQIMTYRIACVLPSPTGKGETKGLMSQILSLLELTVSYAVQYKAVHWLCTGNTFKIQD